MSININNYEAYFLDYYEGSLSPLLVVELMEFVAKHPELKGEFESFTPITLNEIEGIKYEGKEALKKQLTSINAANFDDHAIEYTEGTLPIAKQQELMAFISKTPQFEKELELYLKTKLEADTAIAFEDKQSLKRKAGRPVAFYYWSAAASVAIVVGAYFILNKNANQHGNTLASHNQVKDSNTVAAQIPKQIDTITSVMPKTAPPVPIISNVQNNSVAVKTVKRQEIKGKDFSNNTTQKSSLAIVNIGIDTVKKNRVEKQTVAPVNSENTNAVAKTNVQDTSFMYKSTKKSMNNSSVQEVAATVVKKKKQKGKLLIRIAALACKGLNKISGKHIELEKKYDADDANIVAYQLDLGSKKIQFPVKE